MKPKSPHPHNRLNDKSVRAAKPGYHADGAGLYLVVDPNSKSRRWCLRVMALGKRREVGLGGYPTTSLAEAREEAQRLRKVAKAGGNPIAVSRETRQRQNVPTFREAAVKVHSGLSASWKNKKHKAQWINTLEQYAFPSIGDRSVNEIQTPEILSVLSPIWLTKPETARRVRQRIASVMDWAKAAGHRNGDNPCDGVTKGLPKQPRRLQHHSALPYSQVPKFIADLRDLKASQATRLAFEFLILTAGRTGEVLGAVTSEMDTEQKLWTVPAGRMKARSEHRVPLSDRCLEILTEASALSEGPYVFSGSGSGKPLSNMALLMLLRRMGLKVTVHGFRSSFRDWAQERTNYPREVCERALAHVMKDKAEAAYARSDLFEKRRDLMDAWASFVTSDGAKVIPLLVTGTKTSVGRHSGQRD